MTCGSCTATGSRHFSLVSSSYRAMRGPLLLPIVQMVSILFSVQGAPDRNTQNMQRLPRPRDPEQRDSENFQGSLEPPPWFRRCHRDRERCTATSAATPNLPTKIIPTKIC